MSTLTYSLTLTALAVCVFALALAVRQITHARAVVRCLMDDERIVIGFVRDLLNAYATDTERVATAEYFPHDEEGALLPDMMRDLMNNYMAECGIVDTDNDTAELRRAISGTVVAWMLPVAETGAVSHDA